jgi:hypothetical protein
LVPVSQLDESLVEALTTGSSWHPKERVDGTSNNLLEMPSVFSNQFELVSGGMIHTTKYAPRTASSLSDVHAALRVATQGRRASFFHSGKYMYRGIHLSKGMVYASIYAPFGATGFVPCKPDRTVAVIQAAESACWADEEQTGRSSAQMDTQAAYAWRKPPGSQQTCS